MSEHAPGPINSGEGESDVSKLGTEILKFQKEIAIPTPEYTQAPNFPRAVEQILGEVTSEMQAEALPADASIALANSTEQAVFGILADAAKVRRHGNADRAQLELSLSRSENPDVFGPGLDGFETIEISVELVQQASDLSTGDEIQILIDGKGVGYTFTVHSGQEIAVNTELRAPKDDGLTSFVRTGPDKLTVAQGLLVSSIVQSVDSFVHKQS